MLSMDMGSYIAISGTFSYSTKCGINLSKSEISYWIDMAILARK